jgi:autotransporter-associated beta strand protein
VGTYDLINVTAGTLTATDYILGLAPSGLNYNFSTTNANQTLRLTTSNLNLVYWTGDQDGNWNTNSGPGNTNWASNASGATELGTLAVAADTLVFSAINANAPAGLVATSLNNVGVTADSLRFISALTTPATTAVTIASGGASGILTLNPASSNNGISVAASGGAVTISAPVVAQSNQTWEVDGTSPSSLTVSGGITFTGSVTKTGAGDLTLSGSNSGAGGLNLATGTLVIANNNALGTGTFTIGAGTTLNTGASAIANAGNNVQNWDGNFTFTGTNQLNLGTGTVTLADNVIATVSAQTLTVGGAIGDGASTFGLTKAGAGTLTLSGNNTYGGLTSVTTGTLNLNGDNSGAAGGVTMAGSTNLNLGQANALGSGTFTINGGILNNTSGISMTFGSNVAQVWNSGYTFTGTHSMNMGTGAVTLGATTQITTAANTLTVNGVIDDGASTFGVTKLGAGTLSLGGLNTYGGATVLDQGALIFTTDQVLTAGTNNLTLGAAAGSTAAYSLDLTGASAQFGGTMLVQTSNATANTISLGTGESLRVDGAVTIGYNSAGNTTTNLSVTGASGTFKIGDVGAPTNLNFQLGNGGTANISNAGTLDLSGLATFYANLGAGTFRVGTGGTGGNAVAGSTLILADTSTVIATTITSDSQDATVTQAIKLGSGTNEFNATTITIGGSAGRATGTLDFNAGTGTLKVRALDGVGRAAMNVQNGSASTGASLFGTVDFISGDAGVHTVDLLLGTLAVGGRSAGTTASGTGVFAFDTGTLDATTVNIAARTGTTLTTGNVSGTVTIGGTSSTIGTVTMATNSVALTAGSSTGDATAILNITGGANTITTLTMGVNTVAAGFATGSNTDATINITGGTTTVNTTFTMGAQNSALNAATTVNTAISTLNISAGSLTLAGSTNLTMGQATLDAENAATSSISITGTGSLTVGGNIQYTDAALGTENNTVTLNGGTLDMTNGNIGGAGGTGAGAGIVTFNAQSGRLQNLAQLNNGAGLTKSTAGTLILEGTNAYTGGTTISAGTLQVGGGTIGTGSTTGTLGGGNISNSGTLTINRSNSYTVANNISGAGAVIQAGAGTTILSGTNTYTGKTTVSAGKLSIDGEARLGANPGTSTGDQLNLAGGTLHTTANLNLDDSNRGITVSSNSSIETNAGTTATISSTILGSANLTKEGDGTLIFTAVQTGHTGTVTVNAGTLGGAGGTGGDLVINSGGKLATGTSPGLFTVTGALTINSSGTLSNEITGATANGAATVRAQMNANNNLLGLVGSVPSGWEIQNTTLHGFTLVSSLGSAPVINGTVSLLGGYSPSYGDVFDLMDWAFAGNITGTPAFDFSAITLNAGLAFNTDLFASNGMIVVVPEPSRALLLLLGLLGLVMCRRRS